MSPPEFRGYGLTGILAADDFLGACCRKAMTPKMLWTLLFRVFLNLGFGEPMFAPWILVVFVISVLSVISENPVINLLACGCLSCLRHFRDSHRFREKYRIAQHKFGKT